MPLKEDEQSRLLDNVGPGVDRNSRQFFEEREKGEVIKCPACLTKVFVGMHGRCPVCGAFV